MSVRHIVQQTLQALQFPVKEKDYPCDQTVIKAEASRNATCNTQQAGATAEHQPPSRSTCSMTLRTKFLSQLEVFHSEFAVSAGTDIVRAKLQEPQKEAIQSKPCQGNRCQLCTTFVSANCVTSTSNGRTFHCRNQGTNCNTKWAVYVIMCHVCGMEYVGQTSNIRLRMNGHRSDYQRFLNGDFSKSDTSSLYNLFKIS